jgi:hypothetical protein
MAYVSQDMKAKLAPTIKAICKKYGIKASIAVRHHSTLVLNIRQGSIDFIEHYSGKANLFLMEMIAAMKGPDFFDHSDAQTDYFHRSHYIDINIGTWDKPYALEK